MSLTISLPPETEAKLETRARACGQDLSSFVTKLVTQLAENSPSLEELSGPIYDNFLKAGLDDEELAEVLEQAKNEMRAERRKNEHS